LSIKECLTTTLEGQGRLPTPRYDLPFSEARFEELVRAWRPLGVWLSLWNCSGQPITWDRQGPKLWTALWTAGQTFQNALAAYARASLESSDGEAQSAEIGEQASGPWQPDIHLAFAGVRRRTRGLGVVVAAALRGDGLGESFTRLCNQCGLDRTVMLGLARQAGQGIGLEIGKLAPLLAQAVEQARLLDDKDNELAVLTQNIESTYEELHLIYQISARMGLPQKPAELLERVGAEVLPVTRASAIAFVLKAEEMTGDVPAGAGDVHELSANDRIIEIGRVAPSPSDLERLVTQLDVASVDAAGHVLRNSAASRPELEWTAGWLNHVVALPLCHKQKLLGTMLAINCVDAGDFTSVDVQLLRAVADRIAAFLENQRLYDDLSDLFLGLLRTMVSSVDAKDPYTYGHSERVAYISRCLARAAGIPRRGCERVYLSALLHDVGKIGVPDAILCKPGKLTDEEFDALKKHPEIGVKILSPVRQIRDLIPGVRNHHERMDGRGYPDRLAGQDIPLLGRIICLADSFDAMTTNRTYRGALPVAEAIAEVRRCAGTQFDSELAEVFIGMDPQKVFHDARADAGTYLKLGHIGALDYVSAGQSLESDWRRGPRGN